MHPSVDVRTDPTPSVAIGREAMRDHLLSCGLSAATAAAIDGGAPPAGAVHELRSALRCTLRPDLADELAAVLAELPGGAGGYAVRAARTDDHEGAPHEVIARDAAGVPAAIRACWAAQVDSAVVEPVTAVVVRPLLGGTI